MQSFLNTPAARGSGAAATKQRQQLVGVLGCIAVAAWLTFAVLPGMDETTVPPEPAPAVRVRPTGPLGSVLGVVAKPVVDSSHGDEPVRTIPPPPPRRSKEDAGSAVQPSDFTVLDPWGYNRERNVARWRAIGASIQNDVIDGYAPKHITLVDYGADAGYFSISMAKAFPNAFVIAVELGGKGGTLWNKTAIDVHRQQEEMVSKHGIDERHITLCQTVVKPEHFAELRDRKQYHTYQFVLSVFHWFQLPTRADFERVVVDLFSNARTTFIELPTIGDNSKLIQKQTGYKYWSKWYDGRSDVAEILRAAIKAQGMTATVTQVASLPWIKWQRVVYRVDVQHGALRGAGPGETENAFAQFSFDCAEHRRIYGCRKRELLQECPASSSSV